MNNKVTVFEFVTEFNNFYNDSLELIEEAYNNKKMSRNYADKAYDEITGLKNEIERTLEARVLSVDKAGAELCNIVENFVKIGENLVENYNLTGNTSSFEVSYHKKFSISSEIFILPFNSPVYLNT